MAIEQRLEKDIISSNENEILAATSTQDMDLTPGNVVVDIAVEGLSKQISDSSAEVVESENVIASDQATNTSDADMDLEAKKFLVTRRSATYGTGVVTFYRRFPPLGTYIIPIGTLVAITPDASGNYISFTTTAAAQIDLSTPLVSNTARYEVTAPVICNTIGTAGSAGRNSITRIIFSVNGIDGVINPLAVGTDAIDAETNTELSASILAATAKSKIGTRTGYQEIIATNFPSTLAADVVGPTDPANGRAEFGNEIDVYIIGQNPQSFTDTLTVDGTSFSVFSTHPVLSASSVIGVTNGHTYTPSVEWTFVQDSSAGYGYSTKALDKIQWMVKPSTGTQVYASGVYEKNVLDVQTFLTDPIRRVVATSLLVRNGQQVLIDVYIKISVLTGYNRATVQQTVTTAITDYINGLVLGARIEQADIVATVVAVAGVNEVQIPFTELKTSTEPVLTVHDIGLGRNQFPRIDPLALVVEIIS